MKKQALEVKDTGSLASFKMNYEDLPKKESNRGNTKKDLTIKDNGSIMNDVKLKRKDNKMANKETKTTKEKNYNFVDSIMLGTLVFAFMAFTTIGVHTFVKMDYYMGWLASAVTVVIMLYVIVTVYRIHK